MKNVTISMDEDLHRATRIEAAKAGKSMSRYVSEIVEAVIKGKSEKEQPSQLETIERFLAGPEWKDIKEGRLPAAKDLEARTAEVRIEALRRIWESPTLPLSENGRMPDAEERNARR